MQADVGPCERDVVGAAAVADLVIGLTADEKELKEIIGGIQPAILVPVHTLHPELEENPFGERILPKRGQTATL